MARALQPHVVIQEVPEIDTRVGYVSPLSHSSQLRWTKVRVEIDQVSKLAGILFCSPDSEFGKREVLSHLDLFNERTEDFIELYCAGFGTDEGSRIPREGRMVPIVGDQQWWFSAPAFNSLRKELEARTTWTYSGETDLVLFTANRNASGDGFLSFSPCLLCNLEQMARDSAITSVRAFVEALARFGETYQGRDPISDLSNNQGFKIAGNVLKGLILSILPKPIQEGYQKADHMAVRDISR
jgi:hypothetical protein